MKRLINPILLTSTKDPEFGAESYVSKRKSTQAREMKKQTKLQRGAFKEAFGVAAATAAATAVACLARAPAAAAVAAPAAAAVAAPAAAASAVPPLLTVNPQNAAMFGAMLAGLPRQ